MFFVLISSIIIRTSFAGEVVGCTWDKNCFDPTPYCDTVNNVCVGCLVHEACSGPTAYCDPGSKTCVGCLHHSDCSPPNRLCNPATLVCEPECASNADCKPNEFCDLARDSRVCLCKTDHKRCNGTNQSCDNNGICSCNPGFVNDTTGQCVADCSPACPEGQVCTRDGKCVCGPTTINVKGKCVRCEAECFTDADCLKEGGICTAEHHCECPAGLDLFKGECVAPGYLGGRCRMGMCYGWRVVCNHRTNTCVCWDRRSTPQTICVRRPTFRFHPHPRPHQADK